MGQEDEWFAEGLGRKHTIKWIRMKGGKLCDFSGMLRRNAQETVTRRTREEERLRALNRHEIGLQCVLDADFPKVGLADMHNCFRDPESGNAPSPEDPEHQLSPNER